MIRDPLRPAPNFGVWEVICEYTDVEDNQPIDFRGYPNILVEIEDPFSGAIMMVMSRTSGHVTTPAPGIIIWRVGHGQISALRWGVYHVRMAAWKDDPDDRLPLMDSSFSVIGDKPQ